MKSFSLLSKDNMIYTYDQFKDKLTKNDWIIFDAMKKCTTLLSNPFETPSVQFDYEKKHQEIKRHLEMGVLYGFGKDQVVHLFIEILKIVEVSGGLKGIDINDLYDIAYFRTTYNDLKLRITPDLYLRAEWDIPVNSLGVSDIYNLSIDLYNDSFDEVVPDYVFEYINGSVIAYRNRLYSVSSVLLTIAMEATLRDVLSNKGYSYSKNKSDKRKITGLGTALDIARNDEGFLTPDIIPMDFDKVLTTIRNNLVHLSKTSLPSKIINSDQILNDFINSSDNVFGLLSFILPFISNQYNNLLNDR